ncbi:hypothetical protein HOLleu_29096 [Holothuria leucospilota]|uniref:Uncharacterized protein n=1 Tax=Holothuria leucospilota TaxID=206669 RepID=A0A9Q1BN24_HOLLE|nr:hypothetical protein HOLleu_29096 [Holothuria leucospilota]
MLTDLEFTTRTFLVTKFPQNEAKRASTTTIRTPKPSPKDPVTIGPVKDFITKQGSIPITIVAVISASIVAVAMVATSSFIGSRRSLSRGRSPSLATLPENIELHDA